MKTKRLLLFVVVLVALVLSSCRPSRDDRRSPVPPTAKIDRKENICEFTQSAVDFIRFCARTCKAHYPLCNDTAYKIQCLSLDVDCSRKFKVKKYVDYAIKSHCSDSDIDRFVNASSALSDSLVRLKVALDTYVNTNACLHLWQKNSIVSSDTDMITDSADTRLCLWQEIVPFRIYFDTDSADVFSDACNISKDLSRALYKFADSLDNYIEIFNSFVAMLNMSPIVVDIPE